MELLVKCGLYTHTCIASSIVFEMQHSFKENVLESFFWSKRNTFLLGVEFHLPHFDALPFHEI